ncbi:MAG: formylglycine-generating enzyme family protein, partial [Bacteroidota bacterium]
MRGILSAFALYVIACILSVAHAQEPARSLSTLVYLPMVELPGGTFVMGNTGGTEGESHERPAHEVEVAPFAIGTFEVTQAQFEAVMGYNPSFNPGPEHPVEQVSWYDAVRFCNALSLLDGLTPAYRIDPFEGYTLDSEANGYRLPTEAEWEYAAKAGTTTDTYASDLTVQNGPSATLDTIAWYFTGQVEGRTRPVGQKRPNPFGVYDVIGNVFEWTGSAFLPYPGSVLDPSMPGSAQGAQLNVLRGGAMDAAPRSSRAAYRYRLHPSYTSYNIGFRIVRTT